MKGIISIAAKCRLACGDLRCVYWRTAVDFIRCEAFDCTILRLYDDTVVVGRQPVVEFDISSRLATKQSNRRHPGAAKYELNET